MKANSVIVGSGLLTLCLVALPYGVLSAHPSEETELVESTTSLTGGVQMRTHFDTPGPVAIQSITDSSFYRNYVEKHQSSTVVELDELMSSCNPKNAEVNNQCRVQLGALFHDQPIWDSSQMEHFEYLRGQYLVKFSLRGRVLPFEYSDYLRHSPPTWGDIFDDQSSRRLRTVLDVLNDDECVELASHDGIQPERSDRCKSGDLYKWAIHNEACKWGPSRLAFLSSPRPSAVYGYLTPFEQSIEEINQKVLDPDRRQRILSFQKRSYLLLVWLKVSCDEISNEILQGETGLGNRDSGELQVLQQEIRYLALRIAAKSGSNWAQTSYYPDKEGLGYWRDLHNAMPILVHRYISHGYGFSNENRVRHAVQAQLLLEDFYPDLKIERDWYRRDLLPSRDTRREKWDSLLNTDLGDMKMSWGESVELSGD